MARIGHFFSDCKDSDLFATPYTWACFLYNFYIIICVIYDLLQKCRRHSGVSGIYLYQRRYQNCDMSISSTPARLWISKPVEFQVSIPTVALPPVAISAPEA